MLALHWDATHGTLDLELDPSGALALDEGLHSAVLLSLMTDRCAPPGSGRSAEQARGWWADALEGEPWGSLLWLLAAVPLVEREVGPRLRAYVEQSLAWLHSDGVVQAVVVRTKVVSRDAIALTIELAGAGEGWSQVWTWTKGSLHAA